MWVCIKISARILICIYCQKRVNAIYIISHTLFPPFDFCDSELRLIDRFKRKVVNYVLLLIYRCSRHKYKSSRKRAVSPIIDWENYDGRLRRNNGDGPHQIWMRKGCLMHRLCGAPCMMHTFSTHSAAIRREERKTVSSFLPCTSLPMKYI